MINLIVDTETNHYQAISKRENSLNRMEIRGVHVAWMSDHKPSWGIRRSPLVKHQVWFVMLKYVFYSLIWKPLFWLKNLWLQNYDLASLWLDCWNVTSKFMMQSSQMVEMFIICQRLKIITFSPFQFKSNWINNKKTFLLMT